MTPAASPPGSLRVVGLLLATSYRRAAGRIRLQQQLLAQRQGRKRARNWGVLGFFVFVLLMTLLHACAAFVAVEAVTAGERRRAEMQGYVVVDHRFLQWVRLAPPGRSMEHAIRVEAGRSVLFWGGDDKIVAERLRDAVRGDTWRLMDAGIGAPGLTGLPAAGGIAALLGSLVLLGWSVMLIFQGEGLELDIQRRRHPMWEFLFSHPVRPAAIFLADMLAPVAANPAYCTAPVFPAALYGLVYGWPAGLAAAVLVGVPVTIAAACTGRALEIAVMLRFPARTRGAVAGMMSWLGYVGMLFFVIGAAAMGKLFSALAARVPPLGAFRMPFLDILLGVHGGDYSFPRGVAACWVVAAVVGGLAVSFAVWGARTGLESQAAGAPGRRRDAAGFGRNALYKKELLWLARDRSALVQAILIPLTLAGFQAFNLRRLLAHADAAWNTLSGVAILFGTYFLIVLGPKSLASEGASLWIALTWPQGLEKLLRAKAWLWTLISSAIVALVLSYAAWLFPASLWKVALAGAAWFVFARSMAEKQVTLATVTSESGEIQKVPQGRRLAAQLGTVTFAVGVLTQQWNLAVTGVLYSIVTAAAMWQNFRARLPYFYDPWSEELPRPPTLMHAMIGISVLVEVGALITGGMLALVSREQVALVRVAVYGVCAAIVAGVLLDFLSRRGVRPAEIFRWREAGSVWWRRNGAGPLLAALGAGVLAGLALGGVGLAYVAVLSHFPAATLDMAQSRARLQAVPHLQAAVTVMAVLIAPVAEEFLFRGLLYRALDREWGGWRAVLGSAAFFASYHPVLAWCPVFLLGACNAVLFKKTGRLAPAILAHMVYNAVISAT